MSIDVSPNILLQTSRFPNRCKRSANPVFLEKNRAIDEEKDGSLVIYVPTRVYFSNHYVEPRFHVSHLNKRNL